MTLALAVAALTAVGIWLVLRGGAVRLIVGFVLLGHAANLMLIAAGGTDRRQAPLVGEVDPALAADPLPQAFVLTAIVITFGLTVYLLWLAPRAERDEHAEQAEAEPAAQAGPAADRPGGAP